MQSFLKIRILLLLENHLKQLTKANNDSKFGESIYSAMLADLCQTLYGSQASGSPMLLFHIHARWVCGVNFKPNNSLFVEWVYEKHKIPIDEHIRKEIEGWREFLKQVKSDYFRK